MSLIINIGEWKKRNKRITNDNMPVKNESIFKKMLLRILFIELYSKIIKINTNTIVKIIAVGYLIKNSNPNKNPTDVRSIYFLISFFEFCCFKDKYVKNNPVIICTTHRVREL